MNLNEFANEVHRNAVEHGWWEGERNHEEILALIHSEWSEALEEYRAGRPMVWYECNCNARNFGEMPIVCVTQDSDECPYAGMPQSCKLIGDKPEGIAVELIDGCIRILDYVGRIVEETPSIKAFDENIDTVEKITEEGSEAWKSLSNTGFDEVSLPMAVCKLHAFTSAGALKKNAHFLTSAFTFALCWVSAQGIDPEEIMVEKHRYNTTREYKHGGKRC